MNHMRTDVRIDVPWQAAKPGLQLIGPLAHRGKAAPVKHALDLAQPHERRDGRGVHGLATLVDDVLQAGDQSVRFDATGLQSGTYFYHLEAGDAQLTERFTVVR